MKGAPSALRKHLQLMTGDKPVISLLPSLREKPQPNSLSIMINPIADSFLTQLIDQRGSQKKGDPIC